MRLQGLNEAASRAGLSPGLTLADARARVPALRALDADPQGERATLDRLADWGLRWTPFIGLEPPHGLMLDITGCAHLFGGEAAMHADVAQRIRQLGFEVRAAIADTPGCASGLARFGRIGIAPIDGTEDALAPLPIAALRVSPDTVEALRRVGLVLIGDIIPLPRAPLAARFGASLITRLDQAIGRIGEAIAPRVPVAPHVAERRLAEPISRLEDVLIVAAVLGGDLARTLELAGLGASRLTLTLFNVDGRTKAVTVGTTRPVRDPHFIATLFREKLKGTPDDLETGCGYDLVRLAVDLAAPLAPIQTSFDGPAEAAGGAVAELIDRLGARFGPERIQRPVIADTHLPELAAKLRPAPSQGYARRALNSRDGPVALARSQQDSLGALRPLRLFARPERVETIASVPDGPPVQFRWRRVARRIVQVEGPERIAMEWWRAPGHSAPPRDYFRVEDVDGRRYWLFREGLYGQQIAPPAWFIHGLLA